MIIWINGAFGAGKTTCAFELNKRIKNSYVYDPENIGFFLRKNTPKETQQSDFQDLVEWREINYQLLKKLDQEYSGLIIVPMTIISVQYYDEIIQRLIDEGINVKHIILYASKETLLKRLNKRLRHKDTWAKRKIDQCIDSFDHLITETKIMTDHLSVDEVVEEVANRCELVLSEDKRSSFKKFLDRTMTLIKHIRI